jgi:NAD(P)-dependent dehydrogenase (short-subunit alcohol dehydrogenase family)
MTLQGKVAIVTGGTGGLGGAIVRELLQAGAGVFVPERRAGQVERMREGWNLGPEADLGWSEFDLLDEAAVQAAYERVAAAKGGIDIVVNVAGGFGGGKPVQETPWSLWQQQLDQNLRTTVNSCHAAVPHLLARGGGAIVNVSSRTATQAGAKLAAYAASKRAVLQLTEALAAELRDQGISVNAVLPSTIDTPANRESMPKSDQSRWVKPEDIARVVLFLVGPDARIICGAAVPVYGRA